jgi:hypothetical protein|tara:strand:- start:710 stop:937 length:228 start_codon:yes stop_codon:yes gene_type:complete
MTKFNDDFVREVQQYWHEHKNDIKYKKEGGVHRKVNIDRKFNKEDLAEHFNLTPGQAHRIIYIRKLNGGHDGQTE